jgi:hypothetical protein
MLQFNFSDSHDITLKIYEEPIGLTITVPAVSSGTILEPGTWDIEKGIASTEISLGFTLIANPGRFGSFNPSGCRLRPYIVWRELCRNNITR